MLNRLVSCSLILLCTACGQPLQINPVSSTSIVVTTPYKQSQLDTVPTLTVAPTLSGAIAADPQPQNQLTADALGTFDLNKVPDLDVAGRYYTRIGECRQNACYVKLWPDDVKLWVSRPNIGLPAYIPPTPVPPPPTPIPYCAEVNGFTACGTIGNKDALDAEAAQKYKDSLGLPPAIDTNTDRIAVPSDQLCSGCPPTPIN